MYVTNKSRSYLDSEQHHRVFAEKLEDVSKRQERDVDVILGLQHEH